MAKNYFVHKSSYVEKPCSIGEGTNIWYFCHVMKSAQIGKNCNIGQNVFIGEKVIIGDGVKVQNNVSLYTGVVCEDYVFIGPSVVFTNVINPRSQINRKSQFKNTLVRTGASIGANATIVCGHEIGKYAFVGAGSVVTRDVSDFALVIGNPARQTGWVCECGLKLNFKKQKAVCETCSKIYIKNLNKIKQAIQDEKKN